MEILELVQQYFPKKNKQDNGNRNHQGVGDGKGVIFSTMDESIDELIDDSIVKNRKPWKS